MTSTSPAPAARMVQMGERIQLRRTKGFRLQAASLALNGLPAVKVDRSTKFGNPYDIGDREISWRSTVVEMFRGWISEPSQAGLCEEIRTELAGKNLACWCRESPCHADVLLEIANAPGRTDGGGG